MNCVECQKEFYNNNLGTAENPLCNSCYKKLSDDYSEPQIDYQEAKPPSWMVTLGYIFMVMGGLNALLIGLYLTSSTTNKYGKKIPRFDYTTRKHGKLMQFFGTVIFMIGFFIGVLFKISYALPEILQ